MALASARAAPPNLWTTTVRAWGGIASGRDREGTSTSEGRAAWSGATAKASHKKRGPSWEGPRARHRERVRYTECAPPAPKGVVVVVRVYVEREEEVIDGCGYNGGRTGRERRRLAGALCLD
jgi:hypothetical protein